MVNATTLPRRCARCSKSPNAPCNNTVMTALFRLSPCRARCSTESPTCVLHWRKTMSLHSPTATPRTSLRFTADDNKLPLQAYVSVVKTLHTLEIFSIYLINSIFAFSFLKSEFASFQYLANLIVDVWIL